MSSILPDVVDATRTAASADAGTPAGTVVLRAAGLRVRGGTVTAAGDAAAAGELAVFCRPVVTAPAVVRRDGTVLADAWLPDLVRLGELERHLGDGVIEAAVDAAITEGRLKPRQRRRIMSYPLVIRLMIAMTLSPGGTYCEALARLAGLLADIPFALDWHVPTGKPRRAATQIRSDRRAAGGEHAHHLPANARDLKAMAVIPRDPLQAEPGGEGLFEVLGDDRGDGADVLVVTQRVRRPPLPVRCRPGDVGDLGVDVQLHVTVPGGVLQPVRHRQIRLMPLASLPAVHPSAVGAGAGVSGFALEVAKAGVHGLPDHVVDLADQGGPVRVAVAVAGLPGLAGVFPEGGVEDRDRCWTATGSGRRREGFAGSS